MYDPNTYIIATNMLWYSISLLEFLESRSELEIASLTNFIGIQSVLEELANYLSDEIYNVEDIINESILLDRVRESRRRIDTIGDDLLLRWWSQLIDKSKSISIKYKIGNKVVTRYMYFTWLYSILSKYQSLFESDIVFNRSKEGIGYFLKTTNAISRFLQNDTDFSSEFGENIHNNVETLVGDWSNIVANLSKDLYFDIRKLRL